MKVSEIKTQVGDLTGFDSTDSTVSARLLRFINDVRREIYRENDWDFAIRRYQINLPDDYSTGTVSINQDSRVVTGSGTSFTSDMEGRYIHFAHDSNSQEEWYKIASVTSSTELILDATFVDESISDEDFLIRKVYHRIPGSVQKLDQVRKFTSPRRLEKISTARMYEYYSNLNLVSGQRRFIMSGIYGKEDTYSTGTVTATTGSKTVSGSGTSWLGNVIPGDKLTLNGTEYYVENVDSDTSITLYQKLLSDYSSASYTLTSDPDSLMIRFDYQADGRTLLDIEYYEKCFPLLGDNDEDYVLRNYPELVIEGVLVWEKRATDDNTWSTDYQKWSASVRNVIQSNADNYIWAPRFHKYDADTE